MQKRTTPFLGRTTTLRHFATYELLQFHQMVLHAMLARFRFKRMLDSS